MRELSNFHRWGWEIVPAVFTTNEMNLLSEECDLLMEDRTMLATRGAVKGSPPRNDRLDPVSDISAVFRSTVSDRRLINLAESAVSGQVERLKDKLIFKPPGSTGYALHQDFAYWQSFGYTPDEMVTLAVCIDDMTLQNGAIEFALGCTWTLETPMGEICDPDPERFSQFRAAEATAGDVVIFSSLVPHRSFANKSSFSRRVLFASYVRSKRFADAS